jgi:hypothetical protein
VDVFGISKADWEQLQRETSGAVDSE